MKIRKNQKIHLACDGKGNRLQTENPHLDDKGRLMATDGRMLAIIEGAAEEGEREGPVPKVAIKEALRTAHSHAFVNVSDDDIVGVNGCTYPRDRTKNPPRYDDVINGIQGKPEVTFKISAKALYNLAQAIGANKEGWVQVEVRSPINPFVVTLPVQDETDGKAWGIIMPISQG